MRFLHATIILHYLQVFRYGGTIFRYMNKLLMLQSMGKLEFLGHYAKA